VKNKALLFTLHIAPFIAAHIAKLNKPRQHSGGISAS
jgi:hypothetical protein